MEREEIMVLDKGVEAEEIASRGDCCATSSAPVR
jgi:hypothetical protein